MVGATAMVSATTDVSTPTTAPASPNTNFRLRSASSSSDSNSASRRNSAFDVPSVHGHNHGANGMAPKGIIQGAEEERQHKVNLRDNLISLFLVASYIAVAILFYHYVEGWPVLDCVYFSIVIVTTVGYGDVAPVTVAGKAFTIFFAFYGIATIGMALGRLATWFLERQKVIAKRATQKLMENLAAKIVLDPALVKESSLAAPVKTHNSKKKSRPPKWQRVLFSDSNKTIVWALLPIFLSIGGGVVIGAIEGWPVLDCFYYAVITITTIGFGDLSPKSEAGRIVAIFFLPLSVISVAHGIGSIIEEIGRCSVMKQKISMKDLIAMDSDGDGKVTKMEYLRYMLVKLGKADDDDITGILAQFDKLDKDGSGELDKDDLERLDRELERANIHQHDA
ncbi:TPA: hypothetical protein N0F65_011104 [Lagenidium giganteum]|uniref:EF-hand domain-containing protein n=1 Tax=Lagenidium giganteum TaxID=4803 RepID=A0AAV2ZAV0_9STRA|nr:TPA: hypothetical protein N0F65_011104 [Lagenidium giganteum]